MGNIIPNFVNYIILEMNIFSEYQEEKESSDKYHWVTLYSNCSKLVLKNLELLEGENRIYISKPNTKQEHFPE